MTRAVCKRRRGRVPIFFSNRLTTQPLCSKTLLQPVNGTAQSAGGYFFFPFIPGNRQLKEESAKICGSA